MTVEEVINMNLDDVGVDLFTYFKSGRKTIPSSMILLLLQQQN